MSGNPPSQPPSSSAHPGWIRTRARPNADDQQQQQQQQQQDPANTPHQQEQQPSPSSSPFASSLSAFFPQSRTSSSSTTSTSAGGGGGDLGDYPLFSSRRGAGSKTSAGNSGGAGLASTSPPFGFTSPSANTSTLPVATHLSPPSAISAYAAANAATTTMNSFNLPYSSNVAAASLSARSRRPSVLAISSLLPEDDDEDGEQGIVDGDNQFRRSSGGDDLYNSSPSGSRLGSVSIDGQDEPRHMSMMMMGEDIDMDFADSNNTTGLSSSGVVGGGTTIPPPPPSSSSSRTAAIAIPGRARSSSQSSSIMASSAHLARSPSAWPNSPPRSGFTPSANPQHLLARLTSEQQQAMVASASSASSASYMIPTSYRQAMTAGSGGDLLLGNVDEEAVEDEDATPLDEGDDDMLSSKPSSNVSRKPSSSSGISRSFNPLNPYSERRPSESKREGSRETDRDGMNMDDSPLPSPRSKDTGMLQSFRLPAQNPTLFNLSQTRGEQLRSSKSSPALADMNLSPKQGGHRPLLFKRENSIPFPPSDPSTPTTPPQHSPHANHRSNQSLRRSQSASHRPSELLSLAQQQRDSASAMESDTPPLTAPPASNTFRYQRANSLTDFSRLQRQAGFHLQPLTPVGTLPIDNASSAIDMAGQSSSNGDISQNRDRPASGSSGSDSPNAGPRVVRRAVNHKKGSLMPKSKDHLRTMAQLRLETGEFEVASEAALHRISQSSAAAPSALATPSRRNTTAGISGVPSPFASLPRATGFGYNVDSTAGPSGTNGRPTSSHGGKPPFFNPVRNRFPESVADEEEEIDSSGSEPDYASAAEAGFDPASASDTGGGMGGEDEDISYNAGGDNSNGEMHGFANRSAWTLRDPALYKPLTPGGPGRPVGEMDISPSSALGWTNMGRPGKRKFNDSDRFEPYNAAFKRRAVSPASASSVSLSPLLATRDLQNSNVPPPPPTLATLGPAAQISTTYQGQPLASNASVPPSPVVSGGGTWLNPNKSRGNSPAASVGLPAGPARRWPDEEKERKAVDLSKMSLG